MNELGKKYNHLNSISGVATGLMVRDKHRIEYDDFAANSELISLILDHLGLKIFKKAIKTDYTLVKGDK